MSLPIVPTVDPAQRQTWVRLIEWCKETEFRLAALENAAPAPSTQGFVADTPGLPVTLLPVAADVTITDSEINGLLVVNCSVASAITLPVPSEGAFLNVVNVGTAALTIKSDVGTLAPALQTGGYSEVRAIPDSSGVAKWPTGLAVWGNAGGLSLAGDLVFASNGVGVVQVSPDGHYRPVAISNVNAITASDAGTTPPAI